MNNSAHRNTLFRPLQLMSLRIFVASYLVASFLIASSAQAQNAFRWTDPSGRTMYGEKPPKNARNVEQIKGKSFSRYSSSKLIKGYGYKERPAGNTASKTAEQRIDHPRIDHRVEKIDPVEPMLLDAPGPAQLEAQPVQYVLNESGEVIRCTAQVINTGRETAAAIKISFSFADGTLVPGAGPEQLKPGDSAQYLIPASRLPVKLGPDTASISGTEAISASELSEPPQVIFDFVSAMVAP